MASIAQAEPTLLVIGEGYGDLEELIAELDTHSVFAETAAMDALSEAVMTVAPDLVLFVGTATEAKGAKQALG